MKGEVVLAVARRVRNRVRLRKSENPGGVGTLLDFDVAAYQPTLAVVGMAAYFSAIVRAPLTAIVPWNTPCGAIATRS